MREPVGSELGTHETVYVDSLVWHMPSSLGSGLGMH